MIAGAWQAFRQVRHRSRHDHRETQPLAAVPAAAAIVRAGVQPPPGPLRYAAAISPPRLQPRVARPIGSQTAITEQIWSRIALAPMCLCRLQCQLQRAGTEQLAWLPVVVAEVVLRVVNSTGSLVSQVVSGVLGLPCQLITLSGVLKALVARHLTDLFFRLTDKVLALVLALSRIPTWVPFCEHRSAGVCR
jgi:hypothetical protein